MSSGLIDLAELLQDIPAGAWVAISEERNCVVAFGPDASAVASAAVAKGEPHPLFVRVPEQAAMMFL